jgi:hypothetical protein
MSSDELDSMMKHYLNPTVYTNMCEILDSIRAKVKNSNKKKRSFYKNFY